jgi:hypothetical protein
VVALPAALERDDPLPVVDDAGKLVGVVSSRERGAAVTPNGSQRRRSEAGCRKAAPRPPPPDPFPKTKPAEPEPNRMM